MIKRKYMNCLTGKCLTSLTSSFFVLACLCSCAPRQKGALTQNLNQSLEDQTKALNVSIMQQFDTDEDNQLSEYEFTKAAIGMFQNLDTDQDGQLREKELREKWGSASDQADLNSDKCLSLMEVLKDQETQFKKFDLNHDGFLNPDELMLLVKDKMKNGKVQ